MSPALLSYLCLAFSMTLVGIYVGLSKPLVSVFPVMLIAWLRYSIAIPPMLTWFKRKPDEAPLNLQTGGLLALSAFIGSFLFTLCALNGILLTSTLSAGIIMAGIPATVALLSRIFLKERISLRTLLAIICAIIGITMLAAANMFAPEATTAKEADQLAQELSQSTSNDNAPWKTMLGYLLLIASIFCEAAYVVIGKKLSTTVSPKRICAYFNLWGWIYAAPVGIYLFFQFDFSPVGWQPWALLVFYSLAAGVFSVWAWMTGLKHVPASSAGIFTIMLPISASFVGVLMGEHFGIMHGVALLLSIFGIVLATWPKKGFARKPKL